MQTITMTLNINDDRMASFFAALAGFFSVSSPTPLPVVLPQPVATAAVAPVVPTRVSKASVLSDETATAAVDYNVKDLLPPGVSVPASPAPAPVTALPPKKPRKARGAATASVPVSPASPVVPPETAREVAVEKPGPAPKEEDAYDFGSAPADVGKPEPKAPLIPERPSPITMSDLKQHYSRLVSAKGPQVYLGALHGFKVEKVLQIPDARFVEAWDVASKLMAT